MVSLGDFIPGVNFISHTVKNLGKGIREEGLAGAGKVLLKAYQSDTALTVAAGLATGGAATAALIAGEVALFGADQMGMLDLPSEAAEKAAAEQQADGMEGHVASHGGGFEMPEGDLASRLKVKDGAEVDPETRRMVEEKIRQFEAKQKSEAPVSGVPHW